MYIPEKNMDKILDYNSLNVALKTLGALLEDTANDQINIVVCGGSSLIATGLVNRTTKDVDIVALLDSNEFIMEAQPLPDSLLKAAGQVAISMNLPTNWLNNEPWSIVNRRLPNYGLPEGFLKRTKKRKYGTKLNIYFLDRISQIYFKLYAAVDHNGPSRHLDDLNSLSPTDDEFFAAAQWAIIQDPSEIFLHTLKTMLRVVGHERVAEKL
jgi:hypothetical protein